MYKNPILDDTKVYTFSYIFVTIHMPMIYIWYGTRWCFLINSATNDLITRLTRKPNLNLRILSLSFFLSLFLSLVSVPGCFTLIIFSRLIVTATLCQGSQPALVKIRILVRILRILSWYE